MSIETKLREGSQAIKTATREAEFTSRSPADRRSPVSGPTLAWVGGLAVIALLAVPAMLAGIGGQPSGGVEVGAAPAQPVELPYLLLDLPDTELVDAYDIMDEVSGDRTGIHQVYHQELSDNPDGWQGREFLLRIQEPGTPFEPFDHYMPLAATTDTIFIDGRDITVYEVPGDEESGEGSYDQGMLRWTEAPGYEVILIPWGLDKDEALALLDGLTTINETEWDELKRPEDEPLVTTTIVESETPTTGAVDAPENPAPDGP